MTPDERIARLESQVRLVSSYLRSSGAREAQREAATLEARLAPALLGPSDTLRDAGGRTPDLGAPLMERLRADAALSHVAAGSGLSAVSAVNLLADPTFDFLVDKTLTTSWAPVGPLWEGRYTLDSGSAPTIARVVAGRGRDFWGSAQPRLEAYWPSPAFDGKITVQLRSRHPSGAPSGTQIAWPYIVAAMRCYGYVADYDEAYIFRAKVSIIDGDTQAVLISSDPSDLGLLGLSGLEAHPFIELEDWATATDYVPSLQLDLEIESDASPAANLFRVSLGEPSLTYTEEPTPATYQPQVGLWNPIPSSFGCYVRRTTAQSLTNDTPTTLNFNSANVSTDYDIGDFHDPNGNHTRFTAPVDGNYDLIISATWAANNTGYRSLILRKNNTTDVRTVRIARSPTSLTEHQLIDNVPLLAGDYLEVRGRHTANTLLGVTTAVHMALRSHPSPAAWLTTTWT